MRTDYLRRWLVFAAAVLGVLLTARLGVWQLSRADQKLAIQAAIDARAGMGVLDTASLANDAGAAMLQQYRKAQVRGRWVAERTVFLDNRQMHGQPGFFVVTPLRLEGRSDVLLVQRGWVPRDAEQRTRLPDLPLPEGVVTLQGRLAPPPARLYEFSAQSAGRIRQNLDLNAFAAETGLRLLPMSLLQTQTETTGDAPAKANDGLQREWVRPAADVQKNHGYAFQWFAMALLITGLYVWFQLVRPRLRR